PRVTVAEPPDVRRSLMTQKAYAEGMRALYLYTANVQDRIWTGEGGDEGRKVDEGVHDLLLPIVKVVGSERATEQLVESLRACCGSGFLQYYPIEQYIRDSKIDSLYEGTTAIQSLYFFFRKIVKDNGQALGQLAGEISQFLDAEAGNGRLKNERALLKQALDDVQGMIGAMIGELTASQEDPENVNKVGQHSVRLLMSAGDLMIGWQLLQQAEVAGAALDAGASDKDTPFYQGKIAVASFFAKTVLPELSARRAIVEAADNDLMDVDEAAF